MSRPDSQKRTHFGQRLSVRRLLVRNLALLTVLLSVVSLAQGATWYDYEFTAGYWQANLNAQRVINAGSTPADGLSATADPNYVVNNLVPIDTTNPSAQVPMTTIGGETHVLVGAYTDYAGYSRDGATNEVVIGQNRSLWVTPGLTFYDQVVTTEGTAPEDMDQRAREILGMPSSKGNDRVIEVWVKPGDMFRPARDPNMTTTVSPTEFTSAGEAYAHLPTAFKYDAAGTLLTADQAYQNYLNWLDTTVAGNFTINADGTTATSQPYPTTFLGYTYDISAEDGSTTSGTEIEGLSEYIVQGKPWATGSVPAGLENTTAVVQSVFSTSSYATIVRAADGISINGFNVHGTVDTIWAGEKYYQIGDARQIIVQADGKIEEGIEVVSDGYTISNYGKIEGPGKNFDPSMYGGATHRDSTILLHEGGAINNYGTISGENLVIDAGTGTTGTTVQILNQGSIIANVAVSGSTAILADTGAATLENRGLIVGDITLGDTTADTVTAIGGVILGNVSFNGNAGDAFTFNSGTGVTSTLVGNITGVQTVNVTSGTASLNGTIENDLAVAENAGIEVCRVSAIPFLSGGAILPDSPIVTVGGNLTLAAATINDPGATYSVHIYKPSEGAMQNSQIQVTGTATLGIGSLIDVDINQDSATPIRAGETYVVMTAAGGLTDSGTTFKTDSAFLGFDHWVGSGSTQLNVQLRQPTSFESVAQGENQKAVAAALDADHEVGSGSFAVMTNSLLFSTAAEFRQSTDTLAPMPYFAMERTSRRITQDMAAGLSDYLRGRRAYLRRYYGYGPSSSYSSETKVSMEEMQASLNQVSDDEYVFGSQAAMVGYESSGDDYEIVRQQNCGLGYGFLARPFGTFYTQKASADRTGFESNGSGVQVTFDRAHTSQFIFGWEIDYASNAVKFKESMGEGTLDLFRVGPYLSWFDSCKFLNLSVSYGYNANTILRNASYTDHTAFARRMFDAHDMSVYLGGGRDYDWNGYTFTPEMSLQYIYYGRDRFTEQEAAGPACELAAYGGDSLRMMVGTRLSRLFLSRSGRLFIPELNVGWAHEFLADDSFDARFAGGITPFSITPGSIYRDSAYYGAAVTFLPTESISIAGRYRGEVNEGGPFNACELSLTLCY